MSSRHWRTGIGFLGIIVVLGLLAGLLAGCSRVAPPPEPVTISFAHPRPDEAFYQELVRQFNERYPHITIELHPTRWDSMGGTSDVRDVDVFVNSEFALGSLREEGAILDLTPFVEQDAGFSLDDLHPGTVGLFTREGKLWAIPSSADMLVMYFNQDLFDQYNVPVPQVGWTWDDFLSALQGLRDPEADVFGYAPNLQYLDPLMFVYQHGGRIFDDLQNPTRTTFDDPLTVEALDWYNKLVYEYGLVPTPEEAREIFGTRDDIQNGVYLGKVGMWTGMFSERGGRFWLGEWKMRWGMVPLPRDAQAATLTIVEGYFISSQTQHPDVCWQWIAFLSQQAPDRGVPVRRSLLESTAYGQQVGGEAAAVARASMENVLLLPPELSEFADALEIFGRAFGMIYAGQATSQEAMAAAQEQSPLK